MNGCIACGLEEADEGMANTVELDEFSEQQNEFPNQALAQSLDHHSSNEGYPRPWLSRWLKWYTLFAGVAITIIMQGAVIGLSIWSAKNNGIRPVNDKGGKLIVFIDFGIGLSWTFVPTFVFQLYSLTLALIVQETCARQPYVELMRDNIDGAPAEKSVLLDYASWIPPWAVVKAVKYGHWMLACGMTVSLMVQLVVTPFASHLFDTLVTQRPRNIKIPQTTIFDTGVNGFGPRSDLSPILDIVAATKIYGGMPIAWTTDNATLLPLDLSAYEAESGPANISVRTELLSLLPDCRALSPSEYSLGWSQEMDSIMFSAEDRYCPLAPVIYTSSITGYTVYYAETYQVPCSNAANTSRIMIGAALNENESKVEFSNTTAVSCITTYYEGSGIAEISITNGAPTLMSFSTLQTQPTYTRPIFAQNFESQISQPRIVDESGVNSASKFGSLIVEYARHNRPDTFFNGDSMVNATTTILASTFNIMAQRFLVQPGGETMVEGIEYREQTRLRVVLPVAYTILGILTLVWLELIWMHIYTSNHFSSQYEEPRALVGAAAVLCGSALNDDVNREKALTVTGEVANRIVYSWRDERKGWKFDRWDEPRKAAIVKTDHERPLRWFGRT